jgi:hypothetical protein
LIEWRIEPLTPGQVLHTTIVWERWKSRKVVQQQQQLSRAVAVTSQSRLIAKLDVPVRNPWIWIVKQSAVIRWAILDFLIDEGKGSW